MKKTTSNDFEIIRTLGEGAFSTVYLVKRKKDNKQYALKSILMEKLKKIDQQNCLNEIRILSSIHHQNIIAYKESFWNNKNKTLNIIMEYCDDGDLATKINIMKRNNIKFPEYLIWNYIIQILFGLKALHDKGVIHRDLKSANIFLSKINSRCKIGDLNTGKVLKTNKNKNNVNYQMGTPAYFSPEICKNEKASYKSDIWSFGCIVYEMCCLRMPFRGKNLDMLKENICKGKLEKISKRYSNELWEFIQSLLEVDIEKRPNCDKILNSEIIKNKLNKMKKFNYFDNEWNNINNNEESSSSMMDTIEYKNLNDLENKIPNKKKYTKRDLINNSFTQIEYEDTIKNDSSFGEGNSPDLTNFINDRNIIVKENTFINYFKRKNIKPKKNNIINDIKKELVISNDFMKINKNKSCKNIGTMLNKFKSEFKKIEIMNISYDNKVNIGTKKLRKCKKKAKNMKYFNSDIVRVKKKILSKGTLKNLKINFCLQKISDKNVENKKKINLKNKSNKLNIYKPKQKTLNNQTKKPNKNKIICLEKNIINTTSKKGYNNQYTYTKYQNNKLGKLSKSHFISEKKIKKIISPVSIDDCKNDKNKINSIKTKKLTKSNNTSSIYKKKNRCNTLTSSLFNKNQKSYIKKNNNSFNAHNINYGNIQNSNKIKKEKINQNIKVVEINIEPNKRDINIKLTKSLNSMNPFYKIYNKSFTSNMSKKPNSIKKNISIKITN